VGPSVRARGSRAATDFHLSSSAAQPSLGDPGVSPHAVSPHLSCAACPAQAELGHPYESAPSARKEEEARNQQHRRTWEIIKLKKGYGKSGFKREELLLQRLYTQLIFLLGINRRRRRTKVYICLCCITL